MILGSPLIALTHLDTVKNKRSEKAAKFSVPLPKVRGIAEEEMFKYAKSFHANYIIHHTDFRNLKGCKDWKEDRQEGMEAYDHQAYICWARLYKKYVFIAS